MGRPLQPHTYDNSVILDHVGNKLVSVGTTKPTDGSAGYTPGGLFVDRDAAAGAQTFINEGTAASCDFNPIGSTASPLLGVAGVAAGYKVARGVTALDGSNPTPVVTGLATVVAATVTLEGTAAPGVGTSLLTIASTNYATGALAVYGWKVTATGDATLIASTGTENFEWVAVGT